MPRAFRIRNDWLDHCVSRRRTTNLAITNPVSGAILAAPASVTIQAAVTNGNGAVTNVQFLVASTVLTNGTAAPFSAVTNNLPAGSYTFSAIAADNNGLKATNSISVNVVTPVTVSITAPARTSPTNFHFSYSANVGLRYFVQRSTNLHSTNWLTLATNTAAASPVIFTDINATVNPDFNASDDCRIREPPPNYAAMSNHHKRIAVRFVDA